MTELITPNVSGYLTRPLRTEEEARADIADSAAQEAQAAFWNAIRLGTQPSPTYPAERTTAQLLNLARNKAHCMFQNENLDEGEFNAKMVTFCTTLMDGNELAGKLLASAAVA